MNRRLRLLSLLALLGLGIASLPAPVARAQLLGIEPRFAAYYQDHDGIRLLGPPLTQLHGDPATRCGRGSSASRSPARCCSSPRFRACASASTVRLRVCSSPDGGQGSYLKDGSI